MRGQSQDWFPGISGEYGANLGGDEQLLSQLPALPRQVSPSATPPPQTQTPPSNTQHRASGPRVNEPTPTPQDAPGRARGAAAKADGPGGGRGGGRNPPTPRGKAADPPTHPVGRQRGDRPGLAARRRGRGGGGGAGGGRSCLLGAVVRPPLGESSIFHSHGDEGGAWCVPRGVVTPPPRGVVIPPPVVR